MGQTIAKNQINQAIKSFAEANNEARMVNAGINSASNIIEISGCHIDGSSFNQNSSNKMSYTASLNVEQSADLAQKIESKVSQAAENLRLNLDLNPGSGKSSNVLNLTEQLASEVNNTVGSNCTASNTASNVLVISDSGTNGCDIRDTETNQTNFQDTTFECATNAVQESTINNYVKNETDQTAKVKTEDALSRVLFLLVLLAVAYIVIRYAGGGGGGGKGGNANASQGATKVMLQAVIICAVSAILSLHVTYNCKKNARGLVPGILPGLHFLRWCKKKDYETRAQGIIGTSFLAGMSITLLDFMDSSSTKTSAQGVTLGAWVAGIAYWAQDKERRAEWRMRVLLGIAVIVAAGVGYAALTGGKAPKAPPAATGAPVAPAPDVSPAASVVAPAADPVAAPAAQG